MYIFNNLSLLSTCSFQSEKNYQDIYGGNWTFLRKYSGGNELISHGINVQTFRAVRSHVGKGGRAVVFRSESRDKRVARRCKVDREC